MTVNTTVTLAKVFYLLALIAFIIAALGLAAVVTLGLAFVAAGLLVG